MRDRREAVLLAVLIGIWIAMAALIARQVMDLFG